MISNNKALNCVRTLIDFCNEQQGCQNCIFRKHGGEHWYCQAYVFDLRDNLQGILNNIEARKNHHGYLD